MLKKVYAKIAAIRHLKRVVPANTLLLKKVYAKIAAIRHLKRVVPANTLLLPYRSFVVMNMGKIKY